MSEQQPKEYLITEAGMNTAIALLKAAGRYDDAVYVLGEIRPLPATAQPPQECEDRNCLECPLWEKCHVMDDMPMCARATYTTARKKAAGQARKEGYAAGCKEERERVLDEMVKLSMMIETNETERWESCGRPKNDGYTNGSHSGYGHALRDMRQWIDTIKRAKSLRSDAGGSAGQQPDCENCRRVYHLEQNIKTLQKLVQDGQLTLAMMQPPAPSAGALQVLDKLDGPETNLEDFLTWIADRFIHVYGENPNIDYIHSLRNRAESARKIRETARQRREDTKSLR